MRKATLRKIKLKKYTERYKNFTACTSCKENCLENNISCLLCRKVFHPKCSKLSKKLSEKMKKKQILSFVHFVYVKIYLFSKVTRSTFSVLFLERGSTPVRNVKEIV